MVTPDKFLRVTVGGKCGLLEEIVFRVCEEREGMWNHEISHRVGIKWGLSLPCDDAYAYPRHLTKL